MCAREETRVESSELEVEFREARMRPWCANAREVVVAGGEGPTVVLAHGYGMDQASWDKILPSITKANKVLLFDWDFTAGAEGAEDDDDEARYTFGRFADDLIALMDEREVRGAVLVGHSMSAMVGCIAAARRPDLFAHLMLLCASPRSIDSGRRRRRLSARAGYLARTATCDPSSLFGFIAMSTSASLHTQVAVAVAKGKSIVSTHLVSHGAKLCTSPPGAGRLITTVD
ncbi:hypothetical protein ACQJBY_004457 [Aegilops geniculata]